MKKYCETIETSYSLNKINKVVDEIKEIMFQRLNFDFKLEILEYLRFGEHSFYDFELDGDEYHIVFSMDGVKDITQLPKGLFMQIKRAFDDAMLKECETYRPTFEIPIIAEIKAICEVEADDVDEAIRLATANVITYLKNKDNENEFVNIELISAKCEKELVSICR